MHENKKSERSGIQINTTDSEKKANFETIDDIIHFYSNSLPVTLKEKSSEQENAEEASDL